MGRNPICRITNAVTMNSDQFTEYLHGTRNATSIDVRLFLVNSHLISEQQRAGEVARVITLIGNKERTPTALFPPFLPLHKHVNPYNTFHIPPQKNYPTNLKSNAKIVPFHGGCFVTN